MFMQDDHHHHHHQQQLYHHHHQELVLPCPPIRPILMDRRWKPNVELAPNCPRCDSSNTKFCYYNNYSLTQPRYFCKGCRRYWTKGGSLRNVPIGGGCRKNRRGKSVRISTNNRSSPRSTSNYEGGGDSSGGSLQGVNGVSRNESFGNLVNNNAPPVTSIISSQRSDSSTATTTNNNATIDLALVYAKYLNQQPDCTNSRGSIISPTTGTELPRDHHQFGSSFEFVENPTHRLHKPSSQEQCMFGSSTSNLIGSISNPSTGTHLSETKQVCLASHDQQQQPEMSSNYMFQAPLPPTSEDVSSALQDNLWLHSPNSMLTSSSFNWQSTPTQLQGFEPITGDHATTLNSSSLDGNWNSSFHLLPSYETFLGQ